VTSNIVNFATRLADDVHDPDRSIFVPVDDGPRYGIQTGMVQRVAEQGGGYMVDMYVFHNLNCLVSLSV